MEMQAAGTEQQRREHDMPEVGEVVICKTTKILNYGVFAELIEYNNLQGFVHISQVASSWIKNIRNFVKEGEIRTAKVIRVDVSKHQIDLSFTKVSAGEQRAKIEAWKQLKKPQKFIEMLAKSQKADFDTVWKEITEPLMEHYESLYAAFQEIRRNGTGAATGVPEKWLKPLYGIIEKNMELPVRAVRGRISLYSTAPEGVDDIKAALKSAENTARGSQAKLEILYEGSGKYAVRVTAEDYKTVERVLKEAADAAIKSIESSKGKGSFERIES